MSSPSHLGSTLLAHLIETEMLHVPFKETTQWFAGVARGDVDWSLGTLATMKPMLDSHLLRLPAVAQETRSPDRPDVPTVAEARTEGLCGGGVVRLRGDERHAASYRLAPQSGFGARDFRSGDQGAHRADGI